MAAHDLQRARRQRRGLLGRPDELAARTRLVVEVQKAGAGQPAADHAGRHDGNPQTLRHQCAHAEPMPHLVTHRGIEARAHAQRKHGFVVTGRGFAGKENKVFLGQLAQIDLAPPRHGMRLRQADHEGLGHQVQAAHLGRQGVGVHEAQVQLAAPQGLDLIVGVQFLQHLLHARHGRAQGGQHIGQPAIQHRADEADAATPLQPGIDPLHQQADLFGLAQQGQRLAVQHLPCRSQRNVAAAAFQQTHAKLILQLADGV